MAQPVQIADNQYNMRMVYTFKHQDNEINIIFLYFLVLLFSLYCLYSTSLKRSSRRQGAACPWRSEPSAIWLRPSHSHPPHMVRNSSSREAVYPRPIRKRGDLVMAVRTTVSSWAHYMSCASINQSISHRSIYFPAPPIFTLFHLRLFGFHCKMGIFSSWFLYVNCLFWVNWKTD